ncbi:MAG: hypothetical protein ACRCSF_03935, partial [Mycobacteriaceae bacterium]
GSGLLVRPLSAFSLTKALHRILEEPAFRRSAKLAADSSVLVEDPVAVCHRVLREKQLNTRV